MEKKAPEITQFYRVYYAGADVSKTLRHRGLVLSGLTALENRHFSN